MSQSTSDQGRPFLSAPSPQRYFPAAASEEARQRIVRAIVRNEGPAMLIGAAGTGKSLLLAVLAEQFAPRVAVVTLAGAQLCTRRALLQMILCELGLPYRGMDEGELRLAILEFLRSKPQGELAAGAAAKFQASGKRACGAARLLLLVDEADALPVRLLEELRALTNAAAGGATLVSLVLAGGPILEERFADPQLEKFSQRVAARCYLAPMGREETFQYVRSQVAAVGMKPERLFTDDGLEAIYAATGGVPRLVNQLGDQLTWMAEETGCAPVDGAIVQQAWSELQQLPAPWNTETHGGAAAAPASGGVIEFGELGEADELEHFCGHEFRGKAIAEEVEEADDEPPALIPIASARGYSSALDNPFEGEAFEITIEATEQLLASLGSYDAIGLYAAEPDAEPIEQPAEPAPMAENPFAEPFDEEEIILDPYAAFETEMLRSAPQVVNRRDRTFAGDLFNAGMMVARSVPPLAPPFEGGRYSSWPAVAETPGAGDTELDDELGDLPREERTEAPVWPSLPAAPAPVAAPAPMPLPTRGPSRTTVIDDDLPAVAKAEPDAAWGMAGDVVLEKEAPAADTSRHDESPAETGSWAEYGSGQSTPDEDAFGSVKSSLTTSSGIGPIRLHEFSSESSRGGSREVLVIEDDDRPCASLVPARQFRRLFSSLESLGTRSLMG